MPCQKSSTLCTSSQAKRELVGASHVDMVSMLLILLFSMQVRIDHRLQSVTFGAEVSLVEQSIEGPLLQVCNYEIQCGMFCIVRSSTMYIDEFFCFFFACCIYTVACSWNSDVHLIQ